MKRIFCIIGLMLALLGAGCNKDYLDVSNELAEDRDLEKIFSTPVDVRRWQRNIYTGIPNTSNYSRSQITGLDMPWIKMADELKIMEGVDESVAPYMTSTSIFSRWQLYLQIRQANIFLENAREIPRSGEADFIGADELKDLKAQARFLRAYYHYLIFELHGPIPIMDKLADPTNRDIDFARNSVDEVVSFIDKELTEAAKDLKDPDYSNQQLLAVPTKGTAMAVRARLWMYAASPLLNGGYAEALQVKNKDGKRLFPDRDETKWAKALQALQAFIDYAASGHYELHKELTNGALDPDKSLYELHMKYNREVIFARSDANWGTVPNGGVDGWSIPRGARGGSVSTGYIYVTQELVDDFFMNDGLSIEESPKYQQTGFSVVNEDPTKRTEPGTFRQWVHREPRFYQAVFYNGRKWHVGNEVITFHFGGNSGNSDNGTMMRNHTGYIFYKRLSKKIYNLGSNPRSEYRPAILHRLAEFYLLYAEALNEVTPGDPRILEYVDKVRERAGIPKLSVIKPQIAGNKISQREAIQAEMRVELAGEGQRYFDVRRWMIAENASGKGAQGGPFYGMNLLGNTQDFYKRTLIENRAWTKAMYLYPIPFSEIQKSRLLVPNPGY